MDGTDVIKRGERNEQEVKRATQESKYNEQTTIEIDSDNR